ncbi:MAG: alpha/beta hydrolase [Corallococcus sp.]|nr:alpha/beta hydrolase [Corallococcus sp.]
MYTNFTKEEKDKEVLLFLHGWGCDKSVFDAIIPRLGQTAVAIDLWGFGKSQSPSDEGFTVDDYCRCLKEFCDEQNLKRFSVVAHSFGARVAVAFAAQYPEYVQSMVLTGAAGLRRASLKRSLAVARYKITKLLSKCGLCKVKSSASADYSALTSVAMKRTFVKVITDDLSRYAKRVKCPVLLVWGKDDNETPLWMAQKYNRLLKNSALIFLEGGHFAFAQNPSAFAAVTDTFLERTM